MEFQFTERASNDGFRNFPVRKYGFSPAYDIQDDINSSFVIVKIELPGFLTVDSKENVKKDIPENQLLYKDSKSENTRKKKTVYISIIPTIQIIDNF